jgi:NhaP-type Na+/H+ or K+/H+ antiporter
LNDASSLIIFRFAFIAVATGQFIWQDALLSFSWMLIGGIAIGLTIGLVFMKIHKYMPTDTNIDIVLTLVTPYLMYIAAEEIHTSGVLAVVSGGLFLSNKRHIFLSSSSRLHGVNVWESLCFILNGLVFTLIGLDLPEITAGLGTVTIGKAIGYGVLVTGVLVLCRFLAAFGAVLVTLVARNFITVADSRNPGIKAPLMLGWTGMRGVVSLAAALSIPVHLADGTAFPQRNLILFITFIVILLTLLLQGLTLPVLLKKIKLDDPDHLETEEETEHQLRAEMAAFALSYLKSNYAEELKSQAFLQIIARKWEDKDIWNNESGSADQTKKIYLDLLDQQRAWLHKKNSDEQSLNEEIVRRQLKYLDLEEEKFRFI